MPDEAATFVLDASALAKLVIDEPSSAAFRHWHAGKVAAGARFAAPDLLAYELAQVFAKNLPHTVAQGGGLWLDEALHRCLQGIELVPAYGEVARFLDDVTVYDASYLAVAAQRPAVLVTYDKRLVAAARRNGVKTEAPTSASAA